MIEVTDILKVSTDLNISLSDEQALQVLNLYPEYENAYPSDLWFEIIETIIYNHILPLNKL